MQCIFHSYMHDIWWGKLFTDWNNIKSATLQFEGHYQSRIPQDKNYYDQPKMKRYVGKSILLSNIELMDFAIITILFDGTQLLEPPTNLIKTWTDQSRW